jgi:UDP-N-acetylglucosamine--N-acetylmuramyl-(pentapeptide) pyrophosphoryl-undecaprenol N-acetylglucosamine transferase
LGDRIRYLLTGGGTGGHVTPALAIAEELKRRDPDAEFLYVGVKGKAEETMVPAAGHPISFVRSRGYPGMRNLPAFLLFAVAVGLGLLKAVFILLRFRPHVIVATGGYVSAPIVFAAAILRRVRLSRARVFIHEQNVSLGRMNTIAARVADLVGTSFADTVKQVAGGKGRFVGYPARGVAIAGDRSAAREALGLPATAKVVFAFGGSTGARTINRAVVDALPRLLRDPEVVVIHGTGKQLSGQAYDGEADVAARLGAIDPLDDARDRYRHERFFNDIGTYYAAADVVICRAGAGTLSEICAQGLPAVIIPKANLPGDHQVGNARMLVRAGAGTVVYEAVDVASGDVIESVPGEQLAGVVAGLLADADLRDAMADRARSLHDPAILERIGDWVTSLTGRGDAPALVEPPEVAPDRVLGLTSNGLDLLLRKARSGAVPALDDQELRLARYKVDGYLANPNYIQRARGCRMAGLSEYMDRCPLLIAFATGRDGRGKHRQWPIVRRDAFVGLGNLGVLDDDVIAALKVGLADPYYEARFEAAHAIARLSLSSDGWGKLASLQDALQACLGDRMFEPRVACLEALAEVADNADSFVHRVRALHFDPVWKVRAALFNTYQRLVQRGVLDPDLARAEVSQVLLTSTGYNADYPLKAAYNTLQDILDDGEGAA